MGVVLSAGELDGLLRPHFTACLFCRRQLAFTAPVEAVRESFGQFFLWSSVLIREQCIKIGGNLWLVGPNILADNRRILLPPDQLENGSSN